MSVFIAWPWLALVPAALFFAIYRPTRRPLVAVVACLWLLYSIYEYGMLRRWLCSGECNIRVDLLLIYPFLLLMSIAAVTSAFMARKRARRAREG